MFKYTPKSGTTYNFSREELTEMLEDWDMYKDADNLPKWLVVNRQVRSFAEAKRFISLLVNQPQ